ncbi:MAG TPA: alpha-2-macroglobulin family protein, partial [Pirellulaceae bacterium]|nr:alpha-2-macroglobulin family protein [Pirellulaceae bacterium]
LGETLQTDEYGGVVAEYTLPKDAKLGLYSAQVRCERNGLVLVQGGNTFRVEEYKKPEYEVTIDAPQEPVMLGEKITAKISAKYYFGSPVTKAKVTYKVLRTAHRETFFPLGRWDWCYDPGYWWFAYDYAWYPGFKQWCGCQRPFPWWLRGVNNEPPELIAEQEVEIGEDGTVAVEIDTLVAKELHGDTDHAYSITAEVSDESRRTIVGTGNVLVARKPFKVFTWVDRGYYRVGDTIAASFQAQTLDHQPVVGQGELTLLKITYDEHQRPIETPMRRWNLNTDSEGKATQQLRASAKGQYRLSYVLTDSKEHRIEGGYLFTVIGDGYDGQDYRFNSVELIPDRREYSPGDKVKLQINVNRPNSTVLLFVRPANGVYLPPQVLRLQGKSTIHELEIVKRDMPNFFIEAVTISDAQVHTQTKEIVVPPEQRILNVAVLPSAKEYKPGEAATIRVHVTDDTGENYVGSTVVTIYDKAVEYISGGSNVPEIKEFFWKWRRQHQPTELSSLQKWSGNMLLPNKPGMDDLGLFGATVADEGPGVVMLSDSTAATEGGGVRGGGMEPKVEAMKSFAFGAAATPAPPSEMANATAPAKNGEIGGAAPPPALQQPTIRSNFADTAFWAGALTTDKSGIAEVKLTMPENLTNWKVRVWSLGHGTRVGSGEAEVVTRKNLIVRLQAPRFFVQKDEVVLTANVHNYLKTDKEVTVVLETPGDIVQPQGELTQKVTIKAGGEERVDWRVKIASEGEATLRMKALTDEESDAIEVKLPSYIHGMLKQESWAGTVRPTADSAKLVINVPAERRVEQSVLEIHYSPTLAGAMVDALPYLAEYPYGCTEQTLNRFLPAVITQKVLREMNVNLAEIQQKRNNLNAQELGDAAERAKQWKRFDRNPVFEEEELQRMVKEGLTALTNMQCADGGWGWFSGRGEQSWPHTTAVVVHGLQIAKENDQALVPGVLERGIDWLQRYQAAEVQKLKNAAGKVEPWKTSADDVDAFVYMILVDANHDDVAMRDFIYRDRTRIGVYSKAMFGLALHKVKDQEKLTMILKNIEQFLVQDAENETAYLKLPADNYWWYWYGSETEANAYYLKLLAKTNPQQEQASRLVKYLLNNRKHATYWANTRDTALCVEAFADYIRATGVNKPDMVVEILIDGEKRKEVTIKPADLFTFDNKLVLRGAEVKDGKHEIEIRRRGQGPVYFNAYLTNFTLEDNIEKAGLEVKIQRQYYLLKKVDKLVQVAGARGQAVDQQVEKYERVPLPTLATVKSGDLVEIDLEIDSKNDYEYLLFEDFKPAGFEAVNVQSGYVQAGLNAYMELRDNRVAFFVRQLARGKNSISYRLRAETPGVFSALPAQAAAMYAPELKGNSDEIKLKVED